VVAGVLPDGKESVIRTLAEYGKVAMVGDGINEAPALTRADLGVAIGAGADVAIDAADVVLMKSRLTDVSAAVRLSRATLRNIHENLFWAFFYNIICIPLAAGFYQALFGWSWEMNPMIGAAAMSLSSFTVCMNALRLNLFQLRDPSHDRPRNTHKKEIPNERYSSVLPLAPEKHGGNDGGTDEGRDAVYGQCALEAGHAGDEAAHEGQAGAYHRRAGHEQTVVAGAEEAACQMGHGQADGHDGAAVGRDDGHEYA
jgi:Cu2+-exporting ATPase